MNMFKPTAAKTPEEYIAGLLEPRKSEIQLLHDFIRKTLPKQKAHIMSGSIGYGIYPYKSASGREGEWYLVGLASQKNYISLYICSVKDGNYLAEMHKALFPKASVGKSCIRFKKVEDIDLGKLEELLKEAEKTGGLSQLKQDK